MRWSDDARRAGVVLRRVAAREPIGRGGYLAVLRLHTRTGGASSRALSSLARLDPHQRPPRGLPVDHAALAELRRDGITVLPWRLPDDVVARLQALAGRARVVPLAVTGDRYVELDARGPQTIAGLRGEVPMALVEPAATAADPDLQSLIVDPRLLGLATAYLRARPVSSPPALTWTTGVPIPPEIPHRTRNATMYHYDYDGLTSVRVHLYLTDVGPDDAPMRYLRGSHRPSAARSRLLRRGYVGLPDADVHAVYGAERERVITGPAGTVFVSDTHGLHRGSPAQGHERLFGVWSLAGSPWVAPAPGRATVPAEGGDPRFAAMLAAGDPTLVGFEAAP